ncbi:hypothetical protein [Galbitalea soli]|uniref:Uncharacterized protein n=1 Tax=Galbitalea soli TaxID=1268042 RepID=A0A7C9PNR9_9MICO|nr:hypothetical protein [Galbitalea soli]NEM91852.1 hypothetical protein [Galbitalea soli]NYJ29314.1 hypothetical protein [Galbitalea soli]
MSIIAATSPAQAIQPKNPLAVLDQIAAKSPEVAGFLGEASAVSPLAVRSEDPIQARYPVHRSDPVRMAAPGRPDFGISLPFASGGARVASVGGAVKAFSNQNGSDTILVPGRSGMVAMASLIRSANAPSRYSYVFHSRAGVKLISDSATGGVIVTDSQHEPIAMVAAPWAVDALGHRVPTRYETRGDRLTQVVDLTTPGITFPVVADPKTLYFWWGQAIRFTKSETKRVAAAADYGHAALISTFCGLIGLAPGVIACGLVTGAFILLVENTFKIAARKRKCVQINAPYVGIVIGGAFTWSMHVVSC